MSQKLRDLLELIKDCRSKDEAILMLSACACDVEQYGVVNIERGTSIQPLPRYIYVCERGWGKYVKYSELQAFLDRSGTCTPPSSTY